MEEIFIIVERHPTFPVTYGLADISGESIKGKFYQEEIPKIDKTDDVYEVESVIEDTKT